MAYLAAVMLFLLQLPIRADEQLSISLSVPARDDARRIDATGPGPHFHALVSNRARSPLRIWDDTFSWGYYALRVEVTDARGQTSVIHKREVAFTRNIPAFWKLPPGEQLAMDIHLGDSRTWEQPSNGGSRGCVPVTIRAVYDVTPTTESARYGVWTGRVASVPAHVELCR